VTVRAMPPASRRSPTLPTLGLGGGVGGLVGLGGRVGGSVGSGGRVGGSVGSGGAVGCVVNAVGDALISAIAVAAAVNSLG
jgi:hypothetical protein